MIRTLAIPQLLKGGVVVDGLQSRGGQSCRSGNSSWRKVAVGDGLAACVGFLQNFKRDGGLRSPCQALRGNVSRRVHLGRSVRAMAGDKDVAFPAQPDMAQPGEEHMMSPSPEYNRPYKAADKLKGKVAIITGGDSGIGRAIARLYSLEGASVAITYVPGQEEKDADDTLDIVKKCLTSGAKEPIKIGVDLGYDENCKKVIDEVVKHFGKIDILVNNAGVQHTVEKFEDIDPKQVEETFRTNIFSQFFLSKYALKHMPEGGSIINTTSVNAYKGNKSLIDYTSTKGAIVGFTRALALHLATRNIRVNGVAPGPIWTPLIPSTFPTSKVESFGYEVPMVRAGQPEEVATSFVFLASEDASYISGQVLHPNGGLPVNG